MKHRHVLLIGALVAVMTASAVYAEEAVPEAATEQEEASDGLLKVLFGEGGPLNDLLPEGTDVDAMLDTAQEQLDQADSEIGSVLENIYDMAQSEIGSLDPEVLEKYAVGLLGQFMGGEGAEEGEEGEEDEIDWSLLGAYLEMGENYRGEEIQYIKDRNAEMMDPGDVQIVTPYPIYTVDYDLEDEEITNLACMIQDNYRLDDENQLLYVSGAEDIVLFKHQKDEEGTFAVVEATFAEDGENYTASIEKMCDEVGITLDECFEEIAYAEVSVVNAMAEYLRENPDIKGIEYQGEILTADELDEIFYADIDEMLSTEEEALTEDAGSLE